MIRLLIGVSFLLCACCGVALGQLEAGGSAPDFSLVGSDGNTYTLSQFRGRQAVVIAWFPKAFTGG